MDIFLFLYIENERQATMKKFDESDKDVEFYAIFKRFTDEVVSEKGQELDRRLRTIAILAALIGCQGKAAYREILEENIEICVSPQEIKEILYQSAAYLGYGRMKEFLDITDDVMEEKKITYAHSCEGEISDNNERIARGAELQARIFGEHMLNAWKKGHINRWLASNCFGDYYTRSGLDLREREMITFCFLMAQGGCEKQLIAHAGGNMNIGNSREFLITVVSQCLPYIGYPRSLNAIECIDNASK